MNLRRFTARCLPCFRPKGWHTSATAGDCALRDVNSPYVRVGVRIGPSPTSGQRPDYPRKRTSDLRADEYTLLIEPKQLFDLAVLTIHRNPSCRRDYPCIASHAVPRKNLPL